jgi:hypothetical protein
MASQGGGQLELGHDDERESGAWERGERGRQKSSGGRSLRGSALESGLRR